MASLNPPAHPENYDPHTAHANIDKVLAITQMTDDSLNKKLVAILTKYQIRATITIDTLDASDLFFQVTLRRNENTPPVFNDAGHVFDSDISLRGVYVTALRWLAELFADDRELEPFRDIRL